LKSKPSVDSDEQDSDVEADDSEEDEEANESDNDDDEEDEEDDEDEDDADDVEDMADASASSVAQRAVSAGAGAAAVAAAASSMSVSSGSSSGVVRDLSKVPTRVSGRPARVQFSQLNLSKPLLRAVADLGFSTATPVQAATIPVALTGSDVLANAVTGSGKTAAFMLPILERLLYRPRRVPTSRVVVLTPTRELAAQCHSMTENLARYTDIRVCLIVGGLSAQVRGRRPMVVCLCHHLCVCTHSPPACFASSC
jgi:ATP-dependent RNA helicase DDX27